MKTLILYYSLNGNTNLIAETIKSELAESADIVQIKSKKDYPTTKLKSYFWGGKSVLFKEKPDIYPLSIDFEKYNKIIIGTPIWVGTYAPPFNTFLNQYKDKIKNKKIALFCCHGGGGNGKCFANFKNELSSNEFIGEIEFKDPLKNNKDESIKDTKDWIQNLK